MKTGKIIRRLQLVAAILLLFACSKADQAMPLTRENIMAYRSKLVESRDKVTMKDREEAKKSLDGSKKLFAQTFVEPMEALGYSYDRTVRTFAERLEEGKLASLEPGTKTQVEGFVVMAKSVGDFAAQNGFITKETKKALDQIHLK